MGKFIVRETKTGYMFDLKASNGEVIATSEVYASESACLKGVESLKKNGPAANLDDLTLENEEKVVNPKFEVYLDKAGEYRFRLKARNGEIIAASEGYKEKRSCLNGIESVRKNSATSEIEDQTDKAKNISGEKKAAAFAPIKKQDKNVQPQVEKEAGKMSADKFVKAKAEEIAAKLKTDKALASDFKKDPAKTVESVLGTKLPDEQIKSILVIIKEKLGIKEKGGIIAAIKRFLHIK